MESKENNRWLSVVAAIALLCFAACPSETFDSGDAAPVPDGEEVRDAPGRPGRLLYFGPHPDDEFYLAPILGRTCLDLGWYCTLVVATKGEGGSCQLPGGCDPDLASIRVAEMQASAALFSAKLVQWDLGDDGKYEPYEGDVEQVLELWATNAGGMDALVAQTVALIEDEAPDVVYTMDPRHGNYCHPTHRATGALMVKALQEMGQGAPETRFLQGRWAEVDGAPGFLPVVASDPTLRFLDGTEWSTSANAESWAHVLRVINAHPSQFQLTSDQRRAVLTTRDELKRIYWSDLGEVVVDDPLYEGLCSPSTF